MAALDTLVRLHATGNRFAVLDGLREKNLETHDPAQLAVYVCSDPELPLDGLLVLEAAQGGGELRMRVYNRDGSRAEACGNGLRCVAKVAFERGHVKTDGFTVETDAGDRWIVVEEQEGGSVSYVRASVGVPRNVKLDESLRLDDTELRIACIDMGNPHCVLFVPDLDRAQVESLGPRIERHERFPEGTNVEFVARRGDGLAMRVWERGVGETASCGTGAAAAAVAALGTDFLPGGRARRPLAIGVSGGQLEVAWGGPGEEVFVGGSVDELS